MALSQTEAKEIQEHQSQTYPTRREISEGLERVLYDAFPVLDHGFVRVIDYMGNDSAIVQAARVSYGKGLTIIALYALYQKYYNTIFFVWGLSLLAGFAALLWGSTIDILLGTTFIAVLLCIIVTISCFISNKFLFEQY